MLSDPARQMMAVRPRSPDQFTLSRRTKPGARKTLFVRWIAS